MKPDINEQKAYYDSRWDTDLMVNSLQMARCAAILRQLSRLDIRSPRIIDLGCGNGWLTSVLNHFGETVGVDLSAQSAMRRFPHLTFHEADLTHWHPKLQPFDVIVSQEVIEHIELPQDYVNVAANLLKPNGHLILTTPNKKTFLACSNEWRKSWLCQPIENFVTAKELRSLLSPRFNIINLTSIILGHGQTSLYRIVNSAKINRFIGLLGLSPLFETFVGQLKFGLHLIVVARKR